MKEEFPCKVVNLSTAKPGKHGSAKAMITAKDIFTDKQYEETFGTGDMIPAPIVTKQEYQLLDLDVDTGMMTLMGQVDGEIKKCFELQKKEALITVQKWGDKEAVYSFREGA